jgi:hypothetical protein
MNKLERFAKKVGPGGVSCPCCTRNGKRAACRQINRAARRNAKIEVRRAYRTVDVEERFTAQEKDTSHG